MGEQTDLYDFEKLVSTVKPTSKSNKQLQLDFFIESEQTDFTTWT